MGRLTVMTVATFWLTAFRDGFLGFWGLLFLFILLVRLLNLMFQNIDGTYTHPPLEDVLAVASWLGALFATFRTVHAFYFAKQELLKKD